MRRDMSNEGAVHHRVTSETHCSVERGEVRVRREDERGRKAAIEISGDGLRFEEFDVAVTQHRHLAEGMDGEDLRRVQRPFR